MSSQNGSDESNEDHIPSPLPMLNRPLRDELFDNDSDSVAVTSDDMSISNANPITSRTRRQNVPIPIAQAAELLRLAHTYADDLESQAVTSDDMSITNESPLASRPRRQNRPIPLKQVAAMLRPSRAEELDDPAAVTSTSDEDMSIYQNPYPLQARERRIDTFLPRVPAAGLLPATGCRTPRPPRPDTVPEGRARVESDGMPRPPSGFSVVEYGYGWGYDGFERGAFFVAEDTAYRRPASDPTGQRPGPPLRTTPRVIVSNAHTLSPGEYDEFAEQNAALQRYEQSLDLFPGVEAGSSDDGEPSVSGMEDSQEPEIQDALPVAPATPVRRRRGRPARQPPRDPPPQYHGYVN
ncbi:hypothetical protein N7478_006104 [Penicillium angulare]|uniref:uncharacterized protein n=1 Tax=Penicillium angulare TaxID=116970 RepID=UPI002541E49E|nr:uncharacterized protein N7478_006104 [Penicillium angulare]KAJ5280732.1 hypothetical protein N7478_006104 [Penicillium angulare]